MTNYLHVASGALSSGQPWSITAKTTGAISEGAAETAWGGAWHTFFTTSAVAALFSTHVTYTASSTSTATSLWKQSTITRTTHADAGTAVTQELPDQVALCWTIRSGNATKSAHGRLFLPAPVAASLSVGTGGHVSSANAATLGTALAAVRSAIAGAGLTLVILTRKATKSGLPALSIQNVTSGDMSEVLRIQRRRGDKIVAARVAA